VAQSKLSPHPDASRERNALSAIYRRAIERYEEKQKGTRRGARDDDAKEINGCAATKKYTKSP